MNRSSVLCQKKVRMRETVDKQHSHFSTIPRNGVLHKRKLYFLYIINIYTFLPQNYVVESRGLHGKLMENTEQV